MMESTAPAKVILFGEHAVVYGEPAIAMAISLKSHVKITESESIKVNGRFPDAKFHGYIRKAVDMYWHKPNLNIFTHSNIPHSSGMGSSASITVATVSSILGIKKEWNKEKIAKYSFEVEYAVQGSASPIDTSTVTAGGAVLITKRPQPTLLWEIKKAKSTWYINSIAIKPLSLVIGVSNIKGVTYEQVNKVRRYVSWSGFAREIIKEIGAITTSAIKPLELGAYEDLGALMRKNQRMLAILGVSHPKIQAMITRISKLCYGSKITGAGGGGSIIILTDEKEEVMNVLRSAGWLAYAVKMDKDGVKLV